MAHHLYIRHGSSDNGISGPKHIVTGIKEAFACVAAPLAMCLFASVTNRKQHCKIDAIIVIIMAHKPLLGPG
jgi:hypothetical protein